MSALIIIPARMASTRFPDKPMAMIAGKTMIERVWAIAKASSSARDVFIATDDERLEKFAKGFGANVIMTSSKHLTGTDRVAEAMTHFPKDAIVFSLQGDALLTPPWVIDEVLKAMLEDSTIQIATPAVKLEGKALSDFIQTKKEGSSTGTCVVFDQWKNALYFSKSLIPYPRGETSIYRHIGLYAYQKKALEEFSKLPEGVLEKSEKIEPLRALENGIPIRIVEVNYSGRTHGSVDRPEDVKWVESIIAKEGELV